LRHAAPLVRLVAVVQAEVVVDRLRRQHGRQDVGEGLHAVEGAVAADADEAVDPQAVQPVGQRGDGRLVAGVEVVAGRAEDGAAEGFVQLGDGGEQRVEVDVRHARGEQAAEALDEADHLDAPLVGAGDGAAQGGVKGGRVAAGGQDADALHGGNL